MKVRPRDGLVGPVTIVKATIMSPLGMNQAPVQASQLHLLLLPQGAVGAVKIVDLKYPVA
jgi:hypothetical protein